jgi:hypothetical protein
MNYEMIKGVSFIVLILIFFITDMSHAHTVEFKDDLRESQVDDKRSVKRLNDLNKGNRMLDILCFTAMLICIVICYVFS